LLKKLVEKYVILGWSTWKKMQMVHLLTAREVKNFHLYGI
jgi:hypothetical protein